MTVSIVSVVVGKMGEIYRERTVTLGSSGQMMGRGQCHDYSNVVAKEEMRRAATQV